MIYDISVPLSPESELWPGDLPFTLSHHTNIEKSGYNLTSFQMSSHLGTHIDAPSHFIPDGQTIDQIPLETFFGPAIVIECLEDCPEITSEMLKNSISPPCPRILLKTLSKDKYLTNSAIELIISSDCKLLGINQLCLDKPSTDDFPAHKALMTAGIVILENINLTDVPPGDYIYHGIPLNILGAEAAPVRAIIF